MDSLKDVSGVIHDTNWGTFTVPSDWRLSQDDKSAKWEATYMWRRKTPDKPHLTCFLADVAPFRADRPSTAEMRAILALSGVRATDKGQGHHTRIPVNLISAAGKKLRVLVGIVDSARGSIEVRMSESIDLSNEERSQWQK